MMHSSLPFAGDPCTDHQLIELLASLNMTTAQRSVQFVVTRGERRLGHAVVEITDIDPTEHLDAASIVASMLPPGDHVHLLYGGELVTMDGAT